MQMNPYISLYKPGMAILCNSSRLTLRQAQRTEDRYSYPFVEPVLSLSKEACRTITAIIKNVILEATRGGRRIRGVGRNPDKSGPWQQAGNNVITTPPRMLNAGTKSRLFGTSFDYHEFSMTKNRRCEESRQSRDDAAISLCVIR